MCESLFNPAELRFLWKHRGDKNYDLQSFVSNGAFIQYMVFEDQRNFKNVLGKIVTSPREGEAYHWPRLQHENLLPLLDTISINEKISIYISPLIDSNIKTIIHNEVFMADPNCFIRKQAYAEDILWALDYLHSKSLCLMNLTEQCVCVISDKAVICDFSHLFLIERASKVALPALYQAPELKIMKNFDPVSAETWACGVMLLQIFTKHYLPLAFIGEEARQVAKAIKEISYDIIKDSHPGAPVEKSIVEDLRHFLKLFLAEDPKKRVSIRDAATAPFLTPSPRLKINSEKDVCDSDFEQHWNSYRLNWANSNFKRKSVDDFKEIYQREIAKCRAKLKKLPCSNKFINLDFVPKSTSKKFKLIRNAKNTYQKEKKDSDTENDLLEEAAEPQSFKLCPEKLVIGDNGSKMQNSFSDTANTNFSLLEQMPNLGDTENKAELSAFQNKNRVTDPVENIESKCNVMPHLNSKSVLSFENIYLKQIDSVKLSENDRERELSILSDVSKVSSLIRFSPSNSNNTPKQQNKEFIFAIKREKKYLSQNLKRRKSEIMEKQDFKNIDIEEQNTSVISSLRWSDPGIDILEGHVLTSACIKQPPILYNQREKKFDNSSCKKFCIGKEPADLDIKYSELLTSPIPKEFDSTMNNITDRSDQQMSQSLNHDVEHFKKIPGDENFSNNEKIDENIFLGVEFPEGDFSNIEKFSENAFFDIEYPDGDSSSNIEKFSENAFLDIEYPNGDSPNDEKLATNTSLCVEFPDGNSSNIEKCAEKAFFDVVFPDEDSSNCEKVAENIFLDMVFLDGDSNSEKVATNTSLDVKLPGGESSNTEKIAENTFLDNQFPVDDERKIKCKICRTDSYELAISQGLEVVETCDKKAANLKTEKKTPKKFWSRKQRTSNSSGKNCEANPKEQMKDKRLNYILPIRDILLDGTATTMAHHLEAPTLNYSEKHLLNNPAISSKLKSKKKIKKKWIQFLCPGSKY